jgi:hypothetical protein
MTIRDVDISGDIAFPLCASIMIVILQGRNEGLPADTARHPERGGWKSGIEAKVWYSFSQVRSRSLGSTVGQASCLSIEK